ncbi:hypothetical protein SERLA73DRAFT_186574 [Serpula lacrymans var. lacrymans S7.3]|uniref:Methylated-DNA-[protein]-cysteine S-methyltransferase DNA binding domain-containing protein n=2 Tax=Serpula lacrymans var. lacrymans TaxID=341189 RepID=F8Q7I4_SERL3|nr:uncharacterized protein SERLADRAFT_475698 [Serpula lacrymans var. lacrymans S7.9]EGN95522.1 hypothetical protein SERLA73DRAFT_186574 [Serpula lacrymans var. lacrymans S7.3]EGO21049.1 hypothetical protein SERLADRAFT_475698 [Serpula lacrymans var. lacrymans S7.9]
MSDKQQFIIAVYNIVKLIPPQKVISCSHIAKLVGRPKSARQVKEAVKFISHTTPPVPWYRVVSTSGIISVSGPSTQQLALEKEGVRVRTGTVGESRVDLGKWGWYPLVGSLNYLADSDTSETEDWGA